MITLFEYKDKLLYVYSFDPYRRSDHFYDWIKHIDDEQFNYKGLKLSKKDIYITNSTTIENERDVNDDFKGEELNLLKELINIHGNKNVIYAFVIGKKIDDVFYLSQEIFNLPYKFGYHKDISFNTGHLYFNMTNYTYKNIAKAIIEVAEQDFVISDIKIEGVDVVPYDDFNKIVKGMPNRYHFDLYFDNKIEEIIQEHLEIRKSKIEKFENYLKKKGTINQYSSTVISEYEISKYESIYDEIKTMLEDDNISEVVWQNKLLEILPLIYPEYVCVLKEVEFINEHKQKRRIDFLLVDANGYVRVLELKRPFKDRMISKSKYRYNHYALRELNGSIMQVEKYLYHLTRNSLKEEKRLSNKYKEELSGIKLKVVNAKGLIIAGRSNNFKDNKMLDFEIIKNKYRNITEIVTYDDLLERLGNIIKFFKKRSE